MKRNNLNDSTSTYHSIHKPESANNLLEIYRELRACSSLDDVQSLKNRLDPNNQEPLATNEDVSVDKMYKYMHHRVKTLRKTVTQLISQGEFHGITIREELSIKLPTTELVGLQFKSIMDEIEAHMKRTEFLVIGIHGMEGVGKTALIKHVYNKAVENPSIFGSVYWITVSKDCSIHKLQTIIARRVGEDGLIAEDDESIRAGVLIEALKRKEKFVILLDDMSSYLDLSKIGIPEKNGCKLILTTRSVNVCAKMKCNVILEVKPLPTEETRNLVENVGHGIPPEIEETVIGFRQETVHVSSMELSCERGARG